MDTLHWKAFQVTQWLKIQFFTKEINTKWKNTALSLVSRSNEDGVSRSSTALQLVETIKIDRNSKKHSKNKVN